MDDYSARPVVSEIVEIVRLRDDNEALRESAMLWRRLYEGVLTRMQQGEADDAAIHAPEPGGD
jgi:hypothetical protein